MMIFFQNDISIYSHGYLFYIFLNFNILKHLFYINVI